MHMIMKSHTVDTFYKTHLHLNSSWNSNFAYSVQVAPGFGRDIARTHVPVLTILCLKVLCEPHLMGLSV